MPIYQRPELPPLDALRQTTAALKAGNDARAAHLARPTQAPAPRLDPRQENGRSELLALVAWLRRLHQEGQTDRETLVDYYIGFRDAADEFLTALGARTVESRRGHLDAMHEAIASLDLFRAGR
jgi:hypothetical protein